MTKLTIKTERLQPLAQFYKSFGSVDNRLTISLARFDFHEDYSDFTVSEVNCGKSISVRLFKEEVTDMIDEKLNPYVQDATISCAEYYFFKHLLDVGDRKARVALEDILEILLERAKFILERNEVQERKNLLASSKEPVLV